MAKNHYNKNIRYSGGIKMNNVEYVMDKLSLYTEIPVMCLDEKDNIRSCNEEFFAGEAFYEENRDLLQKMLEQSSRQEEPVVCLEESFYFYILLTGQEKYLLGPVILGEVPRRDIWSYRNIRKYVVCQDMLNGTDFRHFVAKLSLVYLAVYHRQMDEVRLLEENGISAISGRSANTIISCFSSVRVRRSGMREPFVWNRSGWPG